MLSLNKDLNVIVEVLLCSRRLNELSLMLSACSLSQRLAGYIINSIPRRKTLIQASPNNLQNGRSQISLAIQQTQGGFSPDNRLLRDLVRPL